MSEEAMLPVAAAVGVSTLAYAAWSYLGSSKKVKSKLPLIPLRPGGLPFFGNLEFGGEKNQVFKNMDGKATRFIVVGQTIVVVPSWDFAEELYKGEGTNVRGGSLIASFGELHGKESLLTIHGAAAKGVRRILLPVFRPSDLIKSSDSIQDILNPAFARILKTGSFNVGPEIERFAWKLGMTFIGVDYEEDKRQFLVDQTHIFLAAASGNPIDLGKYSTFGRGKIAKREIINLAKESVNKRRKMNAAGEKVPNDILQRLLHAKDENGNPLTEVMLLHTLLVFIIGSFDTTCSSMMSVIMNMCRFPEVQEKVHEHIRDVLGADSDEFHGRVKVPEEIWHEMDYIEQVIHETQRYTPPMATSSGRVALRDFDLGGKYHIQKDTVIMFNVLSPTRMERFWPEPNKFDPERFNRMNPGYKKNVAQLNTFGGGRRRCLGQGFARLELKIFMGLLFRDYRVEFTDPTKDVPKLIYPFTFLITGDLHVNLIKREK